MLDDVLLDSVLAAARWYLALIAIGAAGLLPAALLFDRLSSRGVLYARPLALAVIALAAWLVGWSGVAAYGTPVVAGALAALLACSAALAWQRRDLVEDVRARWRWLLAGEALCLAVFASVATARAFAPAAVGTEKPMDLMLIVAVNRATQLPPPDPWLSGHTVSYYHLGHLAADAVGRLAGVPPEIAFNLVTASAGALAALAAAAVAVDIVGLGAVRRRASRWVAGGVAVAALLLVTPLVGVVNLLAANGLGRALWRGLGVEGVPVVIGAVAGVPRSFWWWWPSSRVLPGAINEFPAFTLLLGDPHAHLLALPLDLVALALALAVFEGTRPLTWRRWTMDPARLALTAALFAAICLTNAWDVVVFGAVWAGAGIVAFRRAGWPWPLAISGVARWAAVPAALALAFAAPFLTSIDPPALGVAPVIGEHSDPTRWLLVWAPPLLPALIALALLWPSLGPRLTRGGLARALLVAALPVEAWAIALLARGEGGELLARGTGWIVIAGLVALLGVAGAAAADADRPHRAGGRDAALAAACALLVAVVALVGLTELVRVADAFPGRLNTVFKFWFDGWAMLAVAAGALAGLAADRVELPATTSTARLAAWGFGGGLAVALLAATALYVPAMAISRAGEGLGGGLDALAYLDEADPGLAGAIAWSRVHLDPREDVAVQAIVESYHGGDVLAAASGVPTLLGWPNHQRQWRGAVPEAERRAAVDAIYTGGASEATRAVAQRFGVTHVYLGREERTRYGADVATRFAGWPVAFAAGGAAGSQLVRVP
ncbi:MAG: hypothetical protein EXR64_01160 [Dehalococcoidia bacterium]|nr:hypothetical protein [Dehalococcoidia bacterium]